MAVALVLSMAISRAIVARMEMAAVVALITRVARPTAMSMSLADVTAGVTMHQMGLTPVAMTSVATSTRLTSMATRQRKHMPDAPAAASDPAAIMTMELVSCSMIKCLYYHHYL
jgi:hypothetical protein